MPLLSPHHLLWLAPLLILAGASLWYARRARRQALHVLSRGTGECKLLTNAAPRRRKLLTVALFTSLIFTAIAVLRPSTETVLTEHRKPAKNLIILIDVSKSMGANDSGGLTRLEAAKLLARELVNRRPTDRIGLLSFAGAAFPECPTTLDRTMLLSRIDKLSPGSVPVPGTDLGTAFKEARHLLTEEPPPGSAVLILSDGDNLTGSHGDVIKSYAESNIPIFAVAFGNPATPAPVPNSPYDTQANHDILGTIAATTSGIFLHGKPAEVDEQIDALSSRIDAIELSGDDIAPELFDRPLDLYAYPLTAALILLMLHLFLPLRTKTWHPLTAALAFCLLPAPADAQEASSPDYLEARAKALEVKKPLLLIFTGSDWSALSIAFEDEILSHQVYQRWARKTVVPLLIDLPNTGISPDQRSLNRALAKRFLVSSYPAAIFLDPETETELGRLTHDKDGPAEWIKRADAILAGDITESDIAASVASLPDEVRAQLENPDLTATERSVGFYNKGLELEKADPDLAIKSKDRFKLLVELFTTAAEEAPKDRPDLTFAARHKLAILHHRQGRSLFPEDMENLPPDEMMRLATEAGGDIIKLLKKAQSRLRKALSLYRQAAPLQPGDPGFSTNLAMIYRDLDRAQAYIDYQEAYQKAVEKTALALLQEKRFRKSLTQGVTTRQPINDSAVTQSAEAIRLLVQKGEAITDTPTILKAEDLDEYRLAQEDIDLAPAPHLERHLYPSVDHIQNALDHLIDPMEMQQQPQEGDGEPRDGEPQDPGDEEEDGEGEQEGDRPGQGEETDPEEQRQGDSEADLRRSEKETGDLRDRLLDGLRREYRRRPATKDH
ncbi:MAG: VWA domain-containing protein [Verrucomicrobiaceae bacterium]